MDISKSDAASIVRYLTSAQSVLAKHPSTRLQNQARLMRLLVRKLQKKIKDSEK